jgi:hypothetical protein
MPTPLPEIRHLLSSRSGSPDSYGIHYVVFLDYCILFYRLISDCPTVQLDHPNVRRSSKLSIKIDHCNSGILLKSRRINFTFLTIIIFQALDIAQHFYRRGVDVTVSVVTHLTFFIDRHAIIRSPTYIIITTR